MNKYTLIFPIQFRPFATLLLVLCLLSAKSTSCHHQTGSIGKPATEIRTANYLLKRLHNRELSNVKYLNGQARVLVDGDGQSMSVNANIVWIRDSVLWVNVKKFGLEAVRVLVTRDSIFTLNRLNKTWSAKGLESLERSYSLPDGFGLLQQFILASAWIDPEMTMKSDIKENLHRLSGSNEQLAADYRLEEGSFFLRSQTFFQQKESRNISLSFENYKKTQVAGQFPYLRSVDAFSPETGNMHLEIELNDVEINVPKNIRFEIPTSYSKVE
jgi:hypothetical protein